MPAIWNVGNTSGYNNNKKISSKLTFEEGETFKGRIIGKGDEDSVIIKLTDGWQFSADLLEDSTAGRGQQLLKFKVEGFEDGKIKLRVMNDSQIESEDLESDLVKNFINKEGIGKEDISILKSMIKFDIPLAKSNIDFVKSIFNFSDKLNTKGQIDEFINNYISSKGIDLKSSEVAQIRNTLNEFFATFKTMDKSDILLFLKNNIDITKQNIDSYNKLFKSDINLSQYFESISNEFENLELDKLNNDVNTKVMESMNKEINAKNIENNDSIRYSQKQNMGFKVYDDNNVSNKSTVSLLNLLKSISGTEVNIVKDTVKNILLDNKNLFGNLQLNKIFSNIDSMSDEELHNFFKEFSSNNEITKESLNNALNKLLGKEIKLSDSDASKLKDILNLKINSEGAVEQNTEDKGVKSDLSALKKDISNEFLKSNISKDSQGVDKNILKTSSKLNSSILVKEQMNMKIENMKDVIKQIMSKSDELNSKSLEGRVAEFIKNNLNDFKLFNSISNEYYYLDVPINRYEQEYPCKLIIKDDRKSNKKIDSTNVKMVVAVKTINMGTVDAYLTVLNNNLNVDIKCIDKYVKLLSKGTEQLSERLKDLGYFVDINVYEKVDEVTLTTCREFFDDGSNSALDTKV